jgi:uncharacterized protein (DUF1684 family)
VKRRLAGAVLLTALAACGQRPPGQEPAEYARAIELARAEKDAAFRSAPDSPVPPARRTELLPLAYFPPDETYSVPAALRPEPSRLTLEMPTSTGQIRAMERVGVLEFTLKGQPLSLGAFIESGTRSMNRLFVPFSDQTSGTETYPAGRYLDLDRTPTGLYLVDFNRAYHPYCYYNATYDCPFPPPENRLAIPIRAGERLKESPGSDP